MRELEARAALLSIPHSLEAEQAVLSAVLQNNKIYDDVCDILTGEMFYSPANGLIYTTLEKMILSGAEANPVSMREVLEGSPDVEAVGGWDKIWGIIYKSLIGFLGNRTYAEAIRNCWIRRKLLVLSVDCQERVTKPDGETAQEILDDLEGQLLGIAVNRSDMKTATLADSISAALEDAEVASRTDGLSGAPTGYDEFDEITGGLEPGTVTIIAGRPAMGKAQPLNSRVLLADGSWKTIGTLSIGDRLASIDGAPSCVVGIYPQGLKEIFKITLSDGRSTLACDEHLWRVNSCKFSSKSKILNTATVKNMLTQSRYKTRLSLPLVSGDFGLDKNISVDPWLLGALLGNGYLSSKKISFSTNDEQTLSRLIDKIGSENVKYSGGYDYNILFSFGKGKELKSALDGLGLLDCLSYDKFIPKNYMSSTKNVRLQLLRGLLDTDGWVEKFGTVRFATSSVKLAYGVQELCFSLGARCSLSMKKPIFSYKGEIKEGEISYVLNISHKEKSGLLSLERKVARASIKQKFKAPTITSIESVGSEDAACIEVSHPERLYVTDDYIVTHNTAAGLGIAIRSAKITGKRSLYWSGEVSKKQMSQRAVAAKTNIPVICIRTGKNRGPLLADGTYGPGTPLRQEQWDTLVRAQMESQAIPVEIDDTPAISVPKLYSVARRMVRSKQGLGLIVVDYLALMKGSKQAQKQGKYAEVSEISADLLAMAKSLNVPIVALQQLNRKVEDRDNKRPLGSDLRDSGNLEQDASVIVLLYREEYYLQKDGAPKRKDGETDDRFRAREDAYFTALSDSAGKAVWIVDKNRQGECRDIPMQFNGPQTWFRSRMESAESDAW